MERDLCGVICVDKSVGITSHGVVAAVRRMSGMKTGHTGTLDPDAEGLLPVCLGRATKIADYMSGSDKAYSVEILFGSETDTQDKSGQVTSVIPLAADNEKTKNAVMSFVGEYAQVPPMYSAIKIGGKKLYQMARAGCEIDRKPRIVRIRHIEIIEMKLPERAVLFVRCSKGTYMRTLCEDIGRKLGAAAHMGRLVRREAAGFEIGQAYTLEALGELARAGSLCKALIPIENVPAISALPKAAIRENALKRLLNGAPLSAADIECPMPPSDAADKIAVFTPEGRLAAIYGGWDGHAVRSVTMLL